MSHPIRPVLAGLAVAATLVGVSACGSNSTTSSSSTTTSTSAATSSLSASGSQTSADSTTPTASTSASAVDSASPSMSGVPSAATLFNDARRTSLAATSAHAKGTVIGEDVISTLDLAGRTDSTNQLETFHKESTKGGEPTGTVILLVVGGKYWVRGDQAALDEYAGAANAARIGSKWIEVPSSRGKNLARNYGLDMLLQGLFKESAGSDINTTTKVTLTDLDGKPAYRLAATDADFSMWVSTDADHHLMRMGGTKVGAIDFTDWNSVPLQKAPAAADVHHS